jgi:hypothetical protein
MGVRRADACGPRSGRQPGPGANKGKGLYSLASTCTGVTLCTLLNARLNHWSEYPLMELRESGAARTGA